MSVADVVQHPEQHLSHLHHHQQQEQQQQEKAVKAEPADVKDPATIYRPWEVRYTYDDCDSPSLSDVGRRLIMHRGVSECLCVILLRKMFQKLIYGSFQNL